MFHRRCGLFPLVRPPSFLAPHENSAKPIVLARGVPRDSGRRLALFPRAGNARSPRRNPTARSVDAEPARRATSVRGTPAVVPRTEQSRGASHRCRGARSSRCPVGLRPKSCGRFGNQRIATTAAGVGGRRCAIETRSFSFLVVCATGTRGGRHRGR